MNRFLDKCWRKLIQQRWLQDYSSAIKKKLERYSNLTRWLKTSSFTDSIKIFTGDRFCHISPPKSSQLFWHIRFTLTVSALAGWTNVLLTEVLWLQIIFLIKINICNLSPSTVIYLFPPGISSPAHFTFCLHYLLKQQMYLYSSGSAVFVGHLVLLLQLLYASQHSMHDLPE